MSDKELRTISSFEWASVTQYIVYISVLIGLHDVNCNHIVSFPLVGLGAKALIVRKQRMISVLEVNKAKLERFVCAKKEELGSDEMAVLRSMYVQWRKSIETMRGHVETARAFQKMEEEDDCLFETKVAQDEFPF